MKTVEISFFTFLLYLILLVSMAPAFKIQRFDSPLPYLFSFDSFLFVKWSPWNPVEKVGTIINETKREVSVCPKCSKQKKQRVNFPHLG